MKPENLTRIFNEIDGEDYDLNALIDYVIDKVEELTDQIFDGNFLLLSKIEELTVQAVADRPPLILLNQPAMI